MPFAAELIRIKEDAENTFIVAIIGRLWIHCRRCELSSQDVSERNVRVVCEGERKRMNGEMACGSLLQRLKQGTLLSCVIFLLRNVALIATEHAGPADYVTRSTSVVEVATSGCVEILFLRSS